MKEGVSSVRHLYQGDGGTDYIAGNLHHRHVKTLQPPGLRFRKGKLEGWPALAQRHWCRMRLLSFYPGEGIEMNPLHTRSGPGPALARLFRKVLLHVILHRWNTKRIEHFRLGLGRGILECCRIQKGRNPFELITPTLHCSITPIMSGAN